MRRINKIQLLPTKHQRKLLKEMMLLSSSVYNMTNYIVRQQFINKEKVSSFFDLQKIIQIKDDYKKLGRSYSLPRIQQYCETNSARFKLIKSKKQKKVGLPKYLKNRKTKTTIPSHLVFDGSQYKISQYHVNLPLSIQLRKNYNIKKFKIKYNGILRYKAKQCRSEIHYKDGLFYLHQSIELNDVEKLNIKKSIGIDLGIKRLISFSIQNGFSLKIGNKRFYKQWCYYNKLIAKEQQYLSTLNKKISNKLLRLYSKRKKYQKQLFDNIIAKLFRTIKKHDIQRIIIGDVSGIRNKKRNKKTNSMINNYWSYDILYKKIESKAEELGITIKKINESYTSRTCPDCGNNNKDNCNDRDFKCVGCGYKNDRDIVGSLNILSKGMYGSLKNIHRDEVVPLEVLS
jgi:putative transposase